MIDYSADRRHGAQGEPVTAYHLGCHETPLVCALWGCMTDNEVYEAIKRAESDFPPDHRKTWTVHTTSESKAESDQDWMAMVIANLYVLLDMK